MNREEVGKFVILRELQHKDMIGNLNELGRNTLISLQFDEDLNNRDMKEVLEFIDELEHNQTQKAIECLKEVKKFVDGRTYLAEWIDNKIKELEEGK